MSYWTRLLVALLLLISALISEWKRAQGYTDDAERYKKMRDMCQRASTELSGYLKLDIDDKSIESANNVIIIFAHECIKENIRWYEIHANKQFEAPE